MARTRVADFEVFDDFADAKRWLRDNPSWDLLGIFPYPDRTLYVVLVRRETVRE